MSEDGYQFDTLKIRAGYNPKEHNHAVSVPIYQTAAFDFGSEKRAERLFSYREAGFLYSRIGNPTVDVLEKRVAALDGASGAIAFASGMAAITNTLFNVAEGGGRILTSPFLYGGTVDSFKKLYPKFGIAIDWSDNFSDPEKLEKEIRSDTKAIYVESISNPNTEVADIAALADVAHRHGIPLIVDNTFATPYLVNPIAFGADIVLYSATKNLSGHGNVIAGLVLESGKFNWRSGKFPQFTETYYTLRDAAGKERSFTDVFPEFPFTARLRAVYLNFFGAALSPFSAYLVLLGLETLSERVRKQVANTEKIIEFLKGNEHVSWVKYPPLNGERGKRLAARYLPKGAGSIFSFGLKGGAPRINPFLESLKLFNFHVNVGDAKSLIVNSPKTTHSELTPQEQGRAQLPPETIRVSIGLEDPDDLIADLKQALTTAFAS
ncbi:MAG: aminotransferase class I/II-fold pyridoxal phosphate-dependent enzyme [Oscillospiraceae bacterium]|jgi:O-acetylhomoserine (thiol)-lyase|nr:aminotransferase class I/II-fold pyridoxal phosphate-dependent enzyme [Oscillospiraceae bacterium]MCI1990164.1 aminotransferase class I/II-fold pyridoxal phosphate-dependent enzyme [Oscillospiraceae bacterium]MCI2034879.1 aminotransferase class I/II-fold pyridoxal phosphate-dependent enzyme [Oscillospiraceae bacterium]